MTDASPSFATPQWVLSLTAEIGKNTSATTRSSLNEAMLRLLPRFTSESHFRLLQVKLADKLQDSPHLKNSIELTEALMVKVSTDTTHFEALLSQPNLANATVVGRQAAMEYLTIGHTLMAMSHIGGCLGGTDDEIVAAFTSLAAAMTSSGQNPQALWQRAAEEVVELLQAVITVAEASPT